MDSKLARHVSALSTAAQLLHENVSDFALSADGGALSFLFDPSSSGTKVAVEVSFAAPTKYPHTAATLRCPADGDVDATLQVLADGASCALPTLLDNLFDLYNLESGGVFEALSGEEPEEEEGTQGGEEEEGSDGGGMVDDEDDDTVDMAEAEGRDVTIACAQRHSRWERHEAVVAAGGGGASVSRSRDQSVAERRQIFAPHEAFHMLANELLALFRRGQMGTAHHILADADGDNVYQWRVCIGGFQPGSRLAQDLQDLQASHGYDTVELRISFMRGLHPFYPPKVALIRPRMPAVLAGALASHPLLSLDLWDPWKPCEEWLAVLKDFIQAHGTVELDSPLNAPEDFPSAAYSPLELQLASLERVSPVPAQAAAIEGLAELYQSCDARVETTRPDVFEQSHKKHKTDKKGQYWAAGTGFGTADNAYDEVWDKQRTQAAQAARDAELESVLSGLAVSLECHLHGSEAAGLGGGSASASGPLLPEEEEEIRESCGAFAKVIAWEQVVATVKQSCLLPLLVRELTETTFSDMGERHHYYTACLRVIKQLSCAVAAPLLTAAGIVRPAGEGGSGRQDPGIAAAMERLADQAESFSKVVKTKKIVGTSEDGSRAGSGGAPPPHPGRAGKGSAGGAATEQAVMALAELVAGVQDGIRAATAECSAADDPPSTSTPAEEGEADEEALYKREMKQHQVNCSNYTTEFRMHHYQNEARTEAFNPTSRLVKLGREIAALKSLLPLHPSSSVFVRVDEEAAMLWRVMITGPEDTPYSCGCFIFDVYFTTAYPDAPPKVNLQTTGGRTVRFNPNLYRDGKVCLSLLGTWDGHKSESWDPQVSSITQVLVSIQSLIFVPEPFFNEPGYEKGMGKSASQEKSKEYNRTIREATLEHAVVAQLRKPGAEFAAAVAAHMRLRADTLLRQTEAWIAEATEDGQTRHVARLESLLGQMKPLLARL